MDSSLWGFVRRRAGHRCEYCHIRQEHDPLYTFPVDHTVARLLHVNTAALLLKATCVLAATDAMRTRGRTSRASIL